MAAHRYWRLNIPAQFFTPAMAEVQFRTGFGVPLLFPVDTTAVCKAGNTYGSVPGTYDPSKLADNLISTLWSAGDATANWWSYDYGAASGGWRDITQVVITARNDSGYGQAPAIFTLQWSDDNAAWTSVQTFTSAPWTSAAQVQTFSVGGGVVPPNFFFAA